MAHQNEQELLKAIGLAVGVVILSVISALVIGSILSSSVFSQGEINGANVNESLGVVDNVTNSTFAIIATQPAANCSLSLVNNATGGEVLTSGNYTFYGSACNIILSGTSLYNGTTLNVTYTFTYTDSGSMIVDVDDIADLFGEFITGLLGFLGIIGIVLGVVWLILYVARLFSKGGLNDLGATA